MHIQVMGSLENHNGFRFMIPQPGKDLEDEGFSIWFWESHTGINFGNEKIIINFLFNINNFQTDV